MLSNTLGTCCPSILTRSNQSKSSNDSLQVAIPLPIDDTVSVQFYTTIDDVIDRWKEIVPPYDTFFSQAFLKALELAPPSDSQYRYAVFSTEEQGDIGIGYYQIKTIRLDESIRFDKEVKTSRASKILANVKRSVASRFRAYTLVVGNLTLTGNYGMYFREDIKVEKRFSLIEQSLKILEPKLKQEGIRIRAIMYKDYREEHQMPKDNGYTEFSVQPTMTVHLKPEWKTSDDYAAAMKSKYRVRMRSARKKATNIEKRALTTEEVHAYEKEISKLYRYVSDQAGFNLFILKDNYFYILKKELQDTMTVTGYFLDGQMVGFYTSIKTDNALDAHFLGYDKDYNSQYQLYLNMLYDLVDEGIALGVSHVDMSRTALEIKSSVGATPTDLYLYLRLTSKTIAKYTPKLLDFFTPKEEWKQRNPFK